jgi:hypothetical protein
MALLMKVSGNYPEKPDIRISKFLHIERLQEGWDEEEARTEHLRKLIGWGICISENRLGGLYNYFSLLSLSFLPPPPFPSLYSPTSTLRPHTLVASGLIDQ